jgi:hypothetical protein
MVGSPFELFRLSVEVDRMWGVPGEGSDKFGVCRPRTVYFGGCSRDISSRIAVVMLSA